MANRYNLDHQRRPPKFILNVYRVLNMPEYEQIISWNEQGDGLSVLKPKEFIDEVLSHEFRGIKFTSFQRQLLNYGFEREAPLRKAPINYFHRWFLRERENKLWRVRKAPKPNAIFKIEVATHP